MAVAFTWDATTKRLTIAATGLAAATEYEVRTEPKINGGAALTTNGVTDGTGALTLEFTDLVQMGPGNMFSAFLYDKATAVVVAIMVFTADVSSSGDGVTAAFSHDGANGYTVQIQTQNGRTYVLLADTNGATGGGGSTTWVGNGTLETKTLDLSASPIPGGSIVRVFVGDWDTRQPGNAGPPLACGIQVQGTAGAATSVNPGGGSYDALFIGTAEPIEGSWALTYNGTTTLTAVGTGLVPGRLYGLYLDGCSTNFIEVATADGGGNATIVQTAIIDPATCYSGGPGMQVAILGGPQFLSAGPGYFGGLGKFTWIIQYGTPSAGIAGVGTWTFDGTEFGTVALPTTIGVSYDISSIGDGSIVDIDGPIVGDGTVMTINWRITNPVLFAENSGLSSQTVLNLYNVSVFEDIGGAVFTYGTVFPTPPASTVLVQSPPWRLVVADIVFNGSGQPAFSTLTFLDHRATNRQIHYALRQAGTLAGRVSADDPEINIVHTDGEPLLAEGVRALIALRREGGTPPWKPQFGGIILQANRAVQDDQPYVEFTAYEPRQLLYKRPVRKADGLLLGTSGLTFKQQRGNDILLALLARTEAADGPTYIDTTTGTIEDTDPIDINFQQGSSVGEALDQLEQTGTMDALFPTVYDPVGSPGILAQLNVYILAGSIRRQAIMAWDLPGRTLVGIDWLEDGGQRENNVELYTADGRPTPIQSDATSITKYGSYWGQQNYPVQTQLSAITVAAAVRLLTQKDHPETITIHPSPERAEPPLTGYGLGDWLPTYASKRLGKALAGSYRVYDIVLDLLDDATETAHLVVSANKPPGS